jgi:CheY-like chemotaxis protein
VLKTARPDLILSDITMPNGDGYQLVRMVRSRTPEEGGWTPAIALSGYNDPLDQTRALLAGFQVHLAKPVGALELIVAIRGVVTAARNRS